MRLMDELEENMKKIKRPHGFNRYYKKFFKIMYDLVPRRLSNNNRKMHGIPMKRKVQIRRIMENKI